MSPSSIKPSLSTAKKNQTKLLHYRCCHITSPQRGNHNNSATRRLRRERNVFSDEDKSGAMGNACRRLFRAQKYTNLANTF